jgi:hypothetical protein
MPWSINSRDKNGKKEFCVIKDADGSQEGCHDTREKAVAQLAALNASEDKASARVSASKDNAESASEEKAKAESAEKMGADMYGYPMFGVTSFAEMDELRQARHTAHEVSELVSQFQMLAGNIIDDYEIEDKSGALRGLAAEFVDRIEVAMSDSEMADKQTGLIASLKKAFQSIPEPEEDIETKEAEDNTGLMLWKDKSTGRYRWFAVYSNKFRDDDYPAEIISEKSHKQFAEMAQKGLVPMPELWQWHIPGTRWGQADWVDYTQDGFAVASGLVDEGCEHIAEAYAKDKSPIKVSHGMPKSLLIRSGEDPSIIDFHVTTEISPLPAHKAANPYTGFQMNEVKEMSLSQDQREYLEAHGLNKEGIDQIVQGLTQLSKNAQTDGRESKQRSEDVAQAASNAVADSLKGETEEAEQEAPAAESGTEEEAPAEFETEEYVTRADFDALRGEVAEALAEVVSGTQTIGESVKSLTAIVKELQASDGEKIAQKAAETPPASLAALIAKSVIGQDSARVDGRGSLAKDGPKETEAEKAGRVFFEEWMN